MQDVLNQSFIETDEHLVQKNNIYSGCTAAVALYKPKRNHSHHPGHAAEQQHQEKQQEKQQEQEKQHHHHHHHEYQVISIFHSYLYLALPLDFFSFSFSFSFYHCLSLFFNRDDSTVPMWVMLVLFYGNNGSWLAFSSMCLDVYLSIELVDLEKPYDSLMITRARIKGKRIASAMPEASLPTTE